MAFQRVTLPQMLILHVREAAPECVIDMHIASQHLHVKALLQDASIGKFLLLPTAADHVQIQRPKLPHLPLCLAELTTADSGGGFFLLSAIRV